MMIVFNNSDDHNYHYDYLSPGAGSSSQQGKGGAQSAGLRTILLGNGFRST